MTVPTCLIQCTVVDNAEVGIKFKRFSLTDQGTLKATPVTGFVFFNPISTAVFTYPVFIRLARRNLCALRENFLQTRVMPIGLPGTREAHPLRAPIFQKG